MNGTKHDTEAVDCSLQGNVVGERCTVRYKRYGNERWRGCTSDHAGMSNDKTGENPVRRKPKVSWGR